MLEESLGFKFIGQQTFIDSQTEYFCLLPGSRKRRLLLIYAPTVSLALVWGVCSHHGFPMFFLSSCSNLPPESEGKQAHDFVFSLVPVGPEWTNSVQLMAGVIASISSANMSAEHCLYRCVCLSQIQETLLKMYLGYVFLKKKYIWLIYCNQGFKTQIALSASRISYQSGFQMFFYIIFDCLNLKKGLWDCLSMSKHIKLNSQR